MIFKSIPIKLEQDQTITSLYHSPFDYNLFYLICLAKTGLKVRIILDDIDNIGIDRSNSMAEYAYSEKYFLSKTERTNIRPLTLTLPKHQLANLAVPSLKDFDSNVGISKLKSELGYADTVEHWIRDVTRQFGVRSFTGPDKAFAAAKVDESFIASLYDVKVHIIELLSRFTSKNESAIQFINWLFDDQFIIRETISDCYVNILNKIVDRFDLRESVSIERMSDGILQKNHAILFKEFETDLNLQRLHRDALSIEGKKDNATPPFYAIAKTDGERMLPINYYLQYRDKYMIAPKVLMLNNFENLILPYHAIKSANVCARELMYSNEKVNCNQIFCDDKWFDWISSFDVSLNLDSMEREIYNTDVINFRELPQFQCSGSGLSKQYKEWIISSTIKSIDQAKYPLIYLALLQDKIFYREMPDFYKLTIE